MLRLGNWSWNRASLAADVQMHSCALSTLTMLMDYQHPGKLAQVWNESDPEEEVLAMVIRTGLRYTT